MRRNALEYGMGNLMADNPMEAQLVARQLAFNKTEPNKNGMWG